MLKRKLLTISAVLIVILLKIYYLVIWLTCSIKYNGDRTLFQILERRPEGPVFVLMWHGDMFLPIGFLKPVGNVSAVVSNHFDGNLLAMVLRSVGCGAIRGSSRRGSVLAARSIINTGCHGIIITPDGPAGPRHKIKNSTANLIKKLGGRVIYVTSTTSRCKHLNTWDHFAIPLPFSKITINISDIIDISHMTAEQMADYCKQQDIN